MPDFETDLTNVKDFLENHVVDLNSIAGALDAVLAELPINAETKATIAATIDKIKTSADTVAQSVDTIADGVAGSGEAIAQPVVHIAESDLEKALTDSDAFKTAVAVAVQAYLAANPPAPVAAPAGAGNGDQQGS